MVSWLIEWKLISYQLKFCFDEIYKENSKEKFPLKALVQNPKLHQNDRSETYQGGSETSNVNHNISFHVREFYKI